eukprot:CFRG8470T1
MCRILGLSFMMGAAIASFSTALPVRRQEPAPIGIGNIGNLVDIMGQLGQFPADTNLAGNDLDLANIVAAVLAGNANIVAGDGNMNPFPNIAGDGNMNPFPNIAGDGNNNGIFNTGGFGGIDNIMSGVIDN